MNEGGNVSATPAELSATPLATSCDRINVRCDASDASGDRTGLMIVSDRPQQSASSVIDKDASIPVLLLTKVVKRLRSRATRFAPKN